MLPISSRCHSDPAPAGEESRADAASNRRGDLRSQRKQMFPFQSRPGVIPIPLLRERNPEPAPPVIDAEICAPIADGCPIKCGEVFQNIRDETPALFFARHEQAQRFFVEEFQK